MAKTQNFNHRPDYVAHLPKTDHNLSHDFSFTSSTGHILPLDFQFLNVGERINYTPHIYARSNPLLSAPMLDVDVHIDTFFVPAQMLFTAWDAVRWQINDPISSFWATRFQTGSIDLPLIDISECIGNNLTGAAITDYWSDYLSRFTGLEASTSLSRFTMFDCVAKEQFRLLNHFRLCLGDVFTLASGVTPYFTNSNPRAFYMFPLAYQACFENYYRLDDWEKKLVSSYNVDRAFTNDGSYVKSNPYLLRMAYRPWRLDYFTKVMNNPISSFRNMLGNAQNSSPVNLLANVNNYLSPSVNSQPKALDDSNAGVSSPLAVTQYGLPGQSSNAFVSTSSIRSLFAVEKLNRIIGRTAKDYDSQVLAHFGFKVPHDVKHQLSHLSHSHGLLHVGEVIATADTQMDGGAALGSIAGKGYIIMRGKTTKFTAPTDGVFISLWSCVPRVRYVDTLDKSNFITSRLSLYIPEFDKLGAQPLFAYECDQSFMSNTYRYGWQRRYAEFKEKSNYATLAFVQPRQTPVVNQYSSYIVSRRIYGPNGAGFYADFYCPPTALNANMVVTYDTAWSNEYVLKPWLIYQQDPFIIDYHSDFYLVSSMSAWGEPDLD